MTSERTQRVAERIWPGVPGYERRSGRVIPYSELTPEPEEGQASGS